VAKSNQFGKGQSQPHTDGRKQARPKSTGGSGGGSKSGKGASGFGGGGLFGPGPKSTSHGGTKKNRRK
jgi:hypothetical protein